jgi:hypothetical protein
LRRSVGDRNPVTPPQPIAFHPVAAPLTGRFFYPNGEARGLDCRRWYYLWFDPRRNPADNELTACAEEVTAMASRPANKLKVKKPAGKRRKPVPYSQLLKQAARAKPPQRWYDEAANPFKADGRTGT